MRRTLSPRALRATLTLTLLLALAGCATMGTKLQPPTASIQQLTVNSNGTWSAVVRFQNYSYDTGMHVYSIAATLSLGGKAAGPIRSAPALDIPAMDADIATVTLTPTAAGSAALKAAGKAGVPYTLNGTLNVGKGSDGSARTFPLKQSGYISPVPGVSNLWR